MQSSHTLGLLALIGVLLPVGIRAAASAHVPALGLALRRTRKS